jgi:hypothetical protein
MSLKNIMLRWSKPTTKTEKQNFNLYSSAIERYSVATWFTQAILGAIAYIPIVGVLEYLLPPQFHHSVWWVAIVTIVALHYVLHYEGIELIGSVMEKIQMRWYDWCVPLATVVIFFIADIYGGQASFADMMVDKSKFTVNNDSLMRTDGARAESEFRNDTAQLAKVKESALAMASANRNEDWVKNAQIADLKTRNRDGAAITSLYRKAVSDIEKVFQDGVKEAKLVRDGKIAEAKREVKANKDDKELYAKTVERSANGRSWMVTAIGWLLYALFSIRLTALRLRCGIRRQTHFGDLDAQGGVLEKFMMTLKDAWKRQTHRFTQWMHVKLTKGTAELIALNNQVRMVASPTPQEEDENDDFQSENDDFHGENSENIFSASVVNPPSLPAVNSRGVEDSENAHTANMVNSPPSAKFSENSKNSEDEIYPNDDYVVCEVGGRSVKRSPEAFLMLLRNAHTRNSGLESRQAELVQYIREAEQIAECIYKFCAINTDIIGVDAESAFDLRFKHRRNKGNSEVRRKGKSGKAEVASNANVIEFPVSQGSKEVV